MLRVWILLILSVACIACSKDTDNQLHGKWQLQQVESGGHVEAVDTIYYNFLTSLFRYQIYKPATDSYSGCDGFKTLQEDGQLFLELVGTGIDAFLPSTDWNSHQRVFTIEKISRSQLILSEGGKQYTFRKF
ncbi:MAG: lipocalin-like domain-containing protein [Tannerellaceae bacterium]|nr:lipocalin-like domain-containing protein [Tannerellaceae bacterium]MCD7915226.1 lipocalin-like domain-containing protein [Tannerellaceae bacterium]